MKNIFARVYCLLLFAQWLATLMTSRWFPTQLQIRGSDQHPKRREQTGSPPANTSAGLSDSTILNRWSNKKSLVVTTVAFYFSFLLTFLFYSDFFSTKQFMFANSCNEWDTDKEWAGMALEDARRLFFQQLSYSHQIEQMYEGMEIYESELGQRLPEINRLRNQVKTCQNELNKLQSQLASEEECRVKIERRLTWHENVRDHISSMSRLALAVPELPAWLVLESQRIPRPVRQKVLDSWPICGPWLWTGSVNHTTTF